MKKCILRLRNGKFLTVWVEKRRPQMGKFVMRYFDGDAMYYYLEDM